MIEEFENSLDIRRFIDQQINLAGLMRLLLDKKQTLLFKNQSYRAVSVKRGDRSSSEGSNDEG